MSTFWECTIVRSFLLSSLYIILFLFTTAFALYHFAKKIARLFYIALILEFRKSFGDLTCQHSLLTTPMIHSSSNNFSAFRGSLADVCRHFLTKNKPNNRVPKKISDLFLPIDRDFTRINLKLFYSVP